MSRAGLSVRRATLAFVIGALVLAGCGGDGPTAGSGFPSHTSEVGDVEVIVTPITLDAAGGAFTVVFDTHSGSLDLDVAANARLTVDGTPWTDPTWSGDGAGGHHRSGALRFTAAGPARNEALLTIDGLGEPLTLRWTIGA